MLVLDALFDHIRQISSNVEIMGSLDQFAQFRQLMSELVKRFALTLRRLLAVYVDKRTYSEPDGTSQTCPN
jgi:predicted metal-dependent peptidase